MYKLVVSEKGGPSKELEFDKDEVTIGRVPGNDIILPGNNVSKRHSRVVRQDGRYFVVDLKSTNGTYLNGRRIMTPSPLRAGDKIFVGSFVIVLEAPDLADMGDALEDVPADGASLVEPIPLDQEPMESQPPPPPDNARPTFASPIGGNNPRAAMATQPLSTAPAIAASMALQQQQQQQQGSPLPRMTGTTPSPAAGVRTPSTPNTPSVPHTPHTPHTPSVAPPPPEAPAPVAPRVAPTAPRPAPSLPTMSAGSPLPSAPASARPSVPGIAARSPMGSQPSSAPRPPSGTWGAKSAPAAPAVTPAAPVPVSTPTMPEPMGEPEGLEPDATPVPAAQSATPAPTATPVAEPARPVTAMPTVTVGAKVVESVIQAHRQSVEPAPPGNEYATLLASVVADAHDAGVSVAPHQLGDSNARARARAVVENLARGREGFPPGITPERLVRDVVAELVGAGPIELALDEPDVTSVLVSPSGRVLVGRSSAAGPSPFWFSSSTAVTTAVDRLLHAVGTHRIGDQPFIESALPEGTAMAGAHMTVVYAPGAAAPSIAIERAPRRPASGAELVAAHVLSAAASKALSAALDARRNVFVVGPRGSGRSTLLASLVAQFAAGERVVALEAKPELAHAHRDVAAVPVGKDSKRALEFAHALRPQRLVFAAVDDGLAAGLASALVTGSEGLLAVLEGASASAALARFAAASGHKEDTLGRIAATRPFVLQLARLGDGSARVASIGEARVSDGQVIVDELFTLRVGRSADRAGITAELVETGAHASFTA